MVLPCKYCNDALSIPLFIFQKLSDNVTLYFYVSFSRLLYAVLTFKAQCTDSGKEDILSRVMLEKDSVLGYIIVCCKSRIYNGNNTRQWKKHAQ